MGYRKAAGVKDSNSYLFANTGDEVFRAASSLKNILEDAELEGANLDNISVVKSGNLRKYLATNSQLLNLCETELDWVTRHLGHTQLTHLNNYRLSSSTIEKTKVAKLLVILENGLLEEAQGRNLSDKDLDDLVLKRTQKVASHTVTDIPQSDDSENAVSSTEDCKTNETDPVPKRTQRSTNKLVKDMVEPDLSDDTSSLPLDCSLVKTSSCQDVSDDTSSLPLEETSSFEEPDWNPEEDQSLSLDEEESDEEEELLEPLKTVARAPRRRNTRWSKEAVAALEREFRVELRQNNYPRFKDIRAVKRKYPELLASRTDPQIKSKLAHIIMLKKK